MKGEGATERLRETCQDMKDLAESVKGTGRLGERFRDFEFRILNF
jgi:hypothetical protein